MSLTYITGISGSGKSSVLKELQEKGFEVHGIDEEGYADWIDRVTNHIVPFPQNDPALNFHNWYQRHRWVLSRERISNLKEQFDKNGETVVLVGYADDEDNVRLLFDRVIYLAIDEETIKHRLDSRDDNHFGKTSDEMAAIKKWLNENEQSYRNSAAYVIDATKPFSKVIEEILSILSKPDL